MGEQKRLLDNLVIAAPCSMSWDAMDGDSRVRLCHGCDKHVYNVSDMTRNEAEEFLQEVGATECMRFFRRNDGTIITDNCPVGLRGVRDRAKDLWKTVAGIAAILIGMPAAMAQQSTTGSDKKEPPQMPLGGAPMVRTGDEKEKCDSTREMGKPRMIDSQSSVKLEPAGKQPGNNVKGPASAQNKVKLKAKVTADKKALELYKLAQTNESQGKPLVALSYYRQAISCMDKKCDPKFKEMVEHDMHALEKKQSLTAPKQAN